MKKKLMLCLLLTLALSVSIAFAGGNSDEEDSGPVTIKAYLAKGDENHYNSLMKAAFEASQDKIKIEIVPTDFANAEQQIKTGIASGSPVDVSFYWGSAIKSAFVDDGLALDLTPYLTANNNKWKDTFVKPFLDAGLVDGKYYAISYQPVIETMFTNDDLFKKYNLEKPKTVDEFLAVCEVFKKNGIYAIGTWNTMKHQMLPWAYQIYANDGTLEDVTAGKLPFAGPNETPGLRFNLELLKKIYDNGYWYPGEGALTATQDQVRAAWYEGKIAMHFDANSDAGLYEKECSFKVGMMSYPLVKAGGKYGINVITNALFVPADAKYPKEAIEFIKFYTSPEGQAITNASGRPPSTIAAQSAVSNKLVNDILASTRSPNAVGYRHIQNISSEVNIFFEHMISEVCSGRSIDSVLEELEELRKEAMK
jgi:ABC-type glycerol-3-phosphate transport system substrate-binding protein